MISRLVQRRRMALFRPSDLAFRKLARSPHIEGFNGEKVGKWMSTACLWTVATGVAVVLFGQSIPRIRNDILSKIPYIGDYWSTEVPIEDNPF